MTQAIKGIVGACLTPFTADNRVDGPTFQKIVDFQIRNGVNAIGGPMHSGESLSLSVEERRELARLAVEAAGGRVPVLIHTSFPGTDEVVALSRYAQSIGAQGVIVITPYYWKPPQEALLDHYVTVASALDISVVAYNSPHHLGVSLTPDLLKVLIERCPNFVGIKDASFDMHYFIEACMVTSAARPGFAVLTGIEYLLTSMPVGGSGAFSAFLTPRLVKALYDACAAGDYERARPLQYRLCRLRNIIKDGAASMKAAMEIMGRPIGHPRKPLQKIDSAVFKRMQAELERLGILSEEPYGW
jgi:dihydrodipicolinate synthase/N-acetylneuraminate lyase